VCACSRLDLALLAHPRFGQICVGFCNFACHKPFRQGESERIARVRGWRVKRPSKCASSSYGTKMFLRGCAGQKRRKVRLFDWTCISVQSKIVRVTRFVSSKNKETVIWRLRHTALERRPRSTWRNTHTIRKGETTRNPVRNPPRSSCEKTRGGSGQTGI
jgi:hypothetical protein